MELSWTGEQLELQSMVRRLLSSSAERTPDAVWASFAETGLLGLGVAESLGGSGAGFAEEQILFEEAGRALLPGPLFATVALALPVLAASDAGEDLVPGLVGGERTYCLAWSGAGSYALDPDARGGRLAAEPDGDHVRLSGMRSLVPNLDVADAAIVLDAGPTAYLVELDAAGVSWSDRGAVDETRPLGDLRLDGVQARALVVDEAAVATAMRRGIALAAAELIGVAEAVLATTQEHLRTRTQFGHPIGSFQALAHPTADVYADIEMTRSLAMLVSTLVDDADADGAEVSALAISAGSLGMSACEKAIQAHGGMGMTWESSLHRFYKRARYLRTLMGSPELHRNRIARLRLGAAGVR